MNYHLIRRFVEEEVLKTLSAAPITSRIRRPVVSEYMIVSAKRRGSSMIKITPGAIVTPAARDRASELGIEIRQEMVLPETRPEYAAVVEQVLAMVVAEIESRPRAKDRREPTKKLITAEDIEYLRMTTMVISIGKKTVITPLARDLARRYGLKFKVME